MISIRISSNNHDNHEDDRTCPTQGLHKWVCHASSYSTKLDQEYYKYKYKYNTQPNWTQQYNGVKEGTIAYGEAPQKDMSSVLRHNYVHIL